jgi:hypothetical protein
MQLIEVIANSFQITTTLGVELQAEDEKLIELMNNICALACGDRKEFNRRMRWLREDNAGRSKGKAVANWVWSVLLVGYNCASET